VHADVANGQALAGAGVVVEDRLDGRRQSDREGFVDLVGDVAGRGTFTWALVMPGAKDTVPALAS